MSTVPATIDVLNPRTGQVDYVFAVTPDNEVRAIANSLREAQPAWEALGFDGRVAAMLKWADAMERRRDDLIAAEAKDTGRFRSSEANVNQVIVNVRKWCEKGPDLARTLVRKGRSTLRTTVSYDTQLKPYGLLGVISPWNGPILLSTIDAIPALIAGCAVLIKPSEIAPRFVDPLLQTIAEVPELASVVAYVRGAASTGQTVIENADIVCFTGSVPNGRKVGEACARRFIPAILALGGKDAAVVTETADIERAVQAVLRGGAFNTGMICHAIERVYVAAAIHDEFLARLVEEAGKIRLSHPEGSCGHIGPFIMGRQGQIVDAQIDDAIAKGAKILVGGKSQFHDGGVYMLPTVMTNVDHSMQIMREETFGPVIPVMSFNSEDEAIKLANDCDFGLSAAVIAGSEEEARRIAERIDAGAITLQDTTLSSTMLFDAERGYFGNSGLGSPRSGPTAITRFIRPKVIITNESEPVRLDALGERAHVVPA